MANFVFKMRGLGTDPTFGLAFPLGDQATARALDRLRQESETNDQLLTRLFTKFMDEILIADYLARKAAQVVTVTKDTSVPVADNT